MLSWISNVKRINRELEGVTYLRPTFCKPTFISSEGCNQELCHSTAQLQLFCCPKQEASQKTLSVYRWKLETYSSLDSAMLKCFSLWWQVGPCALLCRNETQFHHFILFQDRSFPCFLLNLNNTLYLHTIALLETFIFLFKMNIAYLSEGEQIGDIILFIMLCQTNDWNCSL